MLSGKFSSCTQEQCEHDDVVEGQQTTGSWQWLLSVSEDALTSPIPPAPLEIGPQFKVPLSHHTQCRSSDMKTFSMDPVDGTFKYPQQML